MSTTRSIAPDVIVITGDLIDRRRFNLDKETMTFVEGAVEIAPVFYIKS